MALATRLLLEGDMSNGRIDENGLPVYAPGDFDYVRVVDRSTGASRNALAPEVTAAARQLSDALGQIVADAEADIAPVIAGLGYLPPVPYASGLNVDSTRFTVIRDGQVYAPAAPVPFTTGAWDAGQWRLIQGVAGADLASGFGAGMVGFNGSRPTVAQMLQNLDELTENKKVKIVAGVLRNIGGTWQFLTDGAHDKIGGLSVEVNSNINLRLNYNFSATKVLALIASPDEAYARIGLSLGASVGQGYADIRGMMPLEFQITTNGNAAPTVAGLPEIISRVTASRTGGAMRMTHTGAVNDAPVVTPIGDSPPVRIEVLNTGAMNLRQVSSGKFTYRVRHTGAAWNLTSNDPNAALDDSSFASSGNVSITTSDVGVTDDISVTSRYGHVAVNSKTQTSFVLRFYDFDGTLLQTAASMEAYVQYGPVQILPNSSTTLPAGTYSVRRGKIPVYWDELAGTSSYGENANIWVIGVFEVP